MIKEAIEKILNLDAIENHFWKIEDNNYSDRPLTRIKEPCEYEPKKLTVHTLTGIKDFVSNKQETREPGLLIHIKNFKEVSVIGELQSDNDNTRFEYANAVMDLDGFRFNEFLELEKFIIAIQSHFVPTEQTEQILDHLGNLATEQVKDNKDDGFSQSIQVRVGIRMKSEVRIANPMKLKPWRTFREIEQPESDCILRLRDDGGMKCALFVADGNSWQLKAIETIKEWVIKNIPGVQVIA